MGSWEGGGKVGKRWEGGEEVGRWERGGKVGRRWEGGGKCTQAVVLYMCIIITTKPITYSTDTRNGNG